MVLVKSAPGVRASHHGQRTCRAIEAGALARAAVAFCVSARKKAGASAAHAPLTPADKEEFSGLRAFNESAHEL